MRPRELGLRTSPFRVDRNRYRLRTHQFPRSCCNCTATRLASRTVWRTTFAILRIPTRLVTSPHSLLWPNNKGVLAFAVCDVANWACILPPSSLDPRLASRAFAVAKDEGRDRLIGDRRPLNRRERSIRTRALALLPTAPTRDLGEIRQGADNNSRHQRLFLLVRGSSLTSEETGDLSSHSPKLA